MRELGRVCSNHCLDSFVAAIFFCSSNILFSFFPLGKRKARDSHGSLNQSSRVLFVLYRFRSNVFKFILFFSNLACLKKRSCLDRLSRSPLSLPLPLHQPEISMFNARLLPLLLSLVGLVKAIDWFEVENLSVGFHPFILTRLYSHLLPHSQGPKLGQAFNWEVSRSLFPLSLASSEFLQKERERERFIIQPPLTLPFSFVVRIQRVDWRRMG